MNAQVPWRGSGTSSFSTGASQTNNSSNTTTSTSTASKYSTGISGSKQELSKQKESSFPSSNTSSTGCHSSTGLSRFTSTRSSIGSSAGSNALNSSNLSTSSSTTPKRENSFNASSNLHREKSGVGSTNSIRDKIALSTSGSSAVKDKTSNASSLVREKSGLSSTSIKREKSNAGSSSFTKEKANTSLENKISNSLNSSSKLLSSLSNDTSSASSATNAFRPSYLRNGLSSTNAGSTPNSTSLSTTRPLPSVDLLSSKISSYEDYGKKSGLNSCATSGGVSGLTGSGTSSGNANTSGNTNNASNTGALGYRLFSARNITASTNAATNETKPIAANTAAMTSSLRTTARFGLRSGTSHAHYSSSLPSAVVKGLGDDTKSGRQEASKSKISDEPATWMSRGTSPNPPGSTTATNEQGAGSSETASEISAEVAPTINPNHDITIVVKHKAVQTDDKLSASPPTLHKYISSIPRPSTTYYSPFNAAMSRFASNKSTNNSSALDTNDSKSSPINNNNNSKSPGSSSTTANDQSRTSLPPSPHTSPSRKPYETVVGSNLTGNSASNKPSTGNNGIVVTLPNKEFRKSALNVGLETREAEQEFAKKQEQLRISKEQQNSVPTLVISGGAAKRDIGRRPPTDPNKSNLAMNGHQSRSMNRLPGSGLVKSASINPNALSKAKSGKNILPIRKNSTSSCSESESSSSMSSSSASLNRKKGMSFKSCNLPPDKGQGRRGSVTSTTSCSSAASSRSSSSERSRSNSKTTASTPRVNNHQSQSPTRPMGEMHDTNGNFPNVVTNTLEEGPKQTSFLLRALASTEERLAWVRRCESGEIPWWMASNSNIPGLAPKNPSSATLLMKSPTAKQIPIQEEASSDSDGTDTEDNLKSKGIVVPLEERTSPDGREIASNDCSPKATLSILSNKAKKNTQLFIGNLTNIDDILGTFSPSPVPPTKEVPPETLPDTTRHDDRNSSDESSDDLDDDDGSSDDGSTGTSSSFEEVDPSSITIHNPLIQPRVLEKSLSSSSSGALKPSIAAAQSECVGSVDNQATSGGGLIPISQREKTSIINVSNVNRDEDINTTMTTNHMM
ncbi:unnamed protein product [Allacma fusca]|uniref:Uncharacterized protein n=1 Tax=Allacma fusca TaxID=39272 RepID=A0A8J2NKQ2_9HEXA|nr:unnamed protein product [Allacma fusca]